MFVPDGANGGCWRDDGGWGRGVRRWCMERCVGNLVGSGWGIVCDFYWYFIGVLFDYLCFMLVDIGVFRGFVE